MRPPLLTVQASFPAAQILHFCSMLRWADLLQHTVDTAGFFPRIALDKPKYTYTPPPPPAPKVCCRRVGMARCSAAR